MSVGHKSSRKHVCFIRLCDFKMTSLVCSCKVLISRLPVAANRCERRTEALHSDAPKRSDVKCFLSLPNMEKDFFPPTAPVTYEVNPPPPLRLHPVARSCHHVISALRQSTQTFSHRRLKAGGKASTLLEPVGAAASASQAATGACLFSPEDDLVGPTKSNKWRVAKSSKPFTQTRGGY